MAHNHLFWEFLNTTDDSAGPMSWTPRQETSVHDESSSQPSTITPSTRSELDSQTGSQFSEADSGAESAIVDNPNPDGVHTHRFNSVQNARFIDDFLYSVAAIFEKTGGKNVVATAIDHTAPTDKGNITVLVTHNHGFGEEDRRYIKEMEKLLAGFFHEPQNLENKEKEYWAQESLLKMVEKIAKQCQSVILHHKHLDGWKPWLPSGIEFEQGLEHLRRIVDNSANNLPFSGAVQQLRDIRGPEPRETAIQPTELAEMTIKAWKFQCDYDLVVHRETTNKMGFATKVWHARTGESSKEIKLENGSDLKNWLDMVERISRLPNALLAIIIFMSMNRLTTITFHSPKPPAQIGKDCGKIHPYERFCPWPIQNHAALGSLLVHCEVQVIHYFVQKLGLRVLNEWAANRRQIKIGGTKKCCFHCYSLVMGHPNPHAHCSESNPEFTTGNYRDTYHSAFTTALGTHYNTSEDMWGMTQIVFFFLFRLFTLELLSSQYRNLDINSTLKGEPLNQTPTKHQAPTTHHNPNTTTTTTMKSPITLTLTLTFFAATALAAPWDPYPAPCGRGVPSGRCATEKMCSGWNGFYVGRECTFYNVDDVGCCYNMREL
ncbi:hypothetical protein B0T16DRAFT_450778 [Cercophora newfieldiana]|uniref:Uncharacterized protein n=1 Tax=Cercophora newfieldiana TaxID=92897 RepID=A0AA39YLZ5_9PEZI|nr:hypothetical protein B0T16DRAFT_450778 [Cercophora newfieldiana]